MPTNEQSVIFTRNSSGLVKALSWWDVFIITISAPTASGILFYSVSTASTYPGASIPLSFLIGMLIFLPICYLAAISSTTIPRSGTLYVLISRVLNPTIGYLSALLFFVGYSLSVGVVANIISGIIGGILVTSGEAGKLIFLKNIGIMLQSQMYGMIGGIILIFLLWIICIKGVKLFRNIMRILFFITVTSTLITIFYFFFISPEGVKSAFDAAWGIGSFQKILAAAKTSGWQFPVFSFDATVGALLVVIWAYGGIEMVSYASGEISKAGKNIVRGYILGWACVGLLYIVLSFAVYYAFGDFIGAYDFLYKNHQDILKGIMPPVSPSIPFYITSIMKNTWIGVLVAIGLTFWFINTMIPYFFGPSRLIFALAMDRAIPEQLAEVNPVTGAPTWATHLTTILAVIGVIMNSLDMKVVLGTIEFAAFFVFWLYGLSAMLLPYTKPGIYEKSLHYKKTVLGIPSIVFFGFLTFAVGWFVMFFTIMHMTIPVALALIVIMLVGMALYLWQQSRNVLRGIDLRRIYSEIPPE